MQYFRDFEAAKERVVIFVDGSNLYHGLKNRIGNAKIDFEKLSRKLAAQRKLVRVYYYNAPVDQSAFPDRYTAQQKFFSALDNVPYFTVRLGRLEPRGKTWVEKGVDVNIAVDMVTMAYDDIYDTCILISGDGDFAVAAEAVKSAGKHVEVAYTQANYQIKKAADRFILLDEKYLADCFLT
jgi:uncharacterized LabA/DUF88 family protein